MEIRKKRGGARPGAGRKRIGETCKKRIIATISVFAFEILHRKKNMSLFIEEAIIEKEERL